MITESSTLRNSAQRVQDILIKYGIVTQLVECNELTRTAQEAVDTIGCEVSQIAKTLIFKTKHSGKPLCVIASGSNRVDEKKIEQIVGEPIEKPDAQYVVERTGFAIGGVAPVGYSFEHQVLVDEDLLTHQEIWAAAGTPYAVFRITPSELLEITRARSVAIKK